MSSFLPTYLLYLILAIIIALPIALTWFFRFWQKKDALSDVNSLVCMLVSVPKDATAQPNATTEPVKDFKDLIAPMEQFYSSLTTIIHQRHFIDWLFSTPAHVSFEIYSVGGVISLAIICPRRIQTIVERQIHSFFTDAVVELGKPPKLFSREQAGVAGVVFETDKNFVLPLKTYQYLEADPLNSLTTALTKLQGSGSAAIQVLIRPISDSWRVHSNVASGHVMSNKIHLVNRSRAGRVMGTISEILNPAHQASPESQQLQQRTPQQETLLTALEEKSAKTGFETIIRVVTTGDKMIAADENLKVLIGAFAQFYSPQLNSFKYRHVPANRLSRDFLLRLFSGAPKMILNVEELSSVYHFPNRSSEVPGMKWLLSKVLPAPANLPKTGTVLGESNFRGVKELVRIKPDDRRRHLFMIGKTGTGKTTLFETMIEQDMFEGNGLCFIDPLGDAIESLLKKVPTHRAKDVIVFDPSDTKFPVGLNLLEYQKPEEKDFLIQEVIEIFYKLFDPNRTGIVGPQWEHWARNAALTVMSRPTGGTLIDIPRLFTDDAFRQESISFVSDPVVKAFWEQQLAKTADFHKSEMYNYFISKFGRFMTNDLMRNIIGQPKSSFNLREVMDNGKILFVNLAKGKIGETNSDLLGLILIAKLQAAAFSRANLSEEQRKDFYLYVDEFQNFTTNTFATILAEARKYRLNLNITNQYFAQLSDPIRDAVIGNVGTLITYRVGAEDAQFLVKELPGLSVEDLTNLDRFQAYAKLLIDLAPSKPFSLTGIKSPSVGSQEMSNWLKKATQVKYASPPVELSRPVSRVAI